MGDINKLRNSVLVLSLLALPVVSLLRAANASAVDAATDAPAAAGGKIALETNKSSVDKPATTPVSTADAGKGNANVTVPNTGVSLTSLSPSTIFATISAAIGAVAIAVAAKLD